MKGNSSKSLPDWWAEKHDCGSKKVVQQSV
jgi:hypothetical protein